MGCKTRLFWNHTGHPLRKGPEGGRGFAHGSGLETQSIDTIDFAEHTPVRKASPNLAHGSPSLYLNLDRAGPAF